MYFAFALLLSPLAWADSCRSLDYRDQLGSPRAQGGTAWCYAHSTADLITQVVGKRVSSIDLATTYLMGDESRLKKLKRPQVQAYLARNPDFIARLHESRKAEEAYEPDRILSSGGIIDTGGRDDEAILLANLKGLCLEEKLPASRQNVTKYLRAIHDDLLENENDDDADTGPIGAIEHDVSRIMAHAFQKWVDAKCGKRLTQKTPLIPHEVAVAENLDDFLHLTRNEPLRAESGRRFLLKELDRVLDSGKVAAVAYESFDLLPRPSDTPASYHGDHSSVVAARKMIGERCHYFIRNHFGQNCGYRPEWEPLCEKENGGVWVPGDALQHLYSVISVR